MSNVSLINGHIDRTKMTDEEVIKAFECCISSSTSLACFNCPMAKNHECNGSNTNVNKLVVENALDLINRQKAEIEKLENIERIATKTIETQSAEIERLEAHNKEYRFCNLVDNVLICSKTLEDYNNFRKATIPKQGKWLINPDGYYPYCSECKTEPKGRVMTKFCPECGADMRSTKRRKAEADGSLQ